MREQCPSCCFDLFLSLGALLFPPLLIPLFLSPRPLICRSSPIPPLFPRSPGRRTLCLTYFPLFFPPLGVLPPSLSPPPPNFGFLSSARSPKGSWSGLRRRIGCFQLEPSSFFLIHPFSLSSLPPAPPSPVKCLFPLFFFANPPSLKPKERSLPSLFDPFLTKQLLRPFLERPPDYRETLL